MTMSTPMILCSKKITGAASARLMIDDRRYINFHGAGYFALTDIAEIRAAVLEALNNGVPFARQLPAASGVVDPVFDEVERESAIAMNTEASVYIPSGYLIGSTAMASLKGMFDLVFLDEEAHFNLKDAAKLCGLPVYAFAHCDSESLNQLLRRRVGAGQRPLVVTDGIFPGTGRLPPLHEYRKLLAPFEGRLFVDESHSFGVVGKNGRGAAEHCEVDEMAAIGATLSKAYCAHGAVVGCPRVMASKLRSIPPVRGACSGSPLSAVAATVSLRYVAKRPELRERLWELTGYLRAKLRAAGFSVFDSPAPIVSFQHGAAAEMQALQRRAFDRGIYVHYVSNYVGVGPEGLMRCALFRDHTQEDIDSLIDAIR